MTAKRSSRDRGGPARLRLLIAFDGAGYHGWQSGRSGRGVADHVSAAVAAVFPGAGDLVSSSRTDSGVHAFGLVAHVDVMLGNRDIHAVCHAINAHLPDDIRIRRVDRVPDSFHARFDAVSKEYRYRLWNEPIMNPLLIGRAWHVPVRMDRDAMKEAARMLEGRHDFHAFTSRRDGALGDPVRTVSRVSIRWTGGECVIAIRGEGFLYKMCRSMVGTLVRVGQGRMSVAEVEKLLLPDAPRTPGINAPAGGLTLWSVGYGTGRIASRKSCVAD